MLEQIGNDNQGNIENIIRYLDQDRTIENIMLVSEIVYQNDFGRIFFRLKDNKSVRFSISKDKNNSNLISLLTFYPDITFNELINIFPKFTKRYIPYDEEYYYSFTNTGFKCSISVSTNTDGRGNELDKSENKILRMNLRW